MKHEKGASLVVALVMLTIITLVAVYSIEGSTIQSKMIASSLFNTLTYQECRNEQEANIRFYNTGNNRDRLGTIVGATDALGDPVSITTITGTENAPITSQYNSHAAKSDIQNSWIHIGPAPASRSGYEVGQDATSSAELFQNDCLSTFRFSTNSQSLGAVVDSLRQNYNQI